MHISSISIRVSYKIIGLICASLIFVIICNAMLIFNAVIVIFALVILVFLRALIVFDKRNELEISFWAVKDEQSFNFVTPNFIFIRNIVLEFLWNNLLLGLSFLFFYQIFPKRYIRRNYDYLTRKIISLMLHSFNFSVFNVATRIGIKLMITGRILKLWAIFVILLPYILCLRFNQLRLSDRTLLGCRHSPIIKTIDKSLMGDLLLDRKISILFLFCFLS